MGLGPVELPVVHGPSCWFEERTMGPIMQGMLMLILFLSMPPVPAAQSFPARDCARAHH